MSFSQFPPSSPFLDTHEEDSDPFTSGSKKFVINTPFKHQKNQLKQSPTGNLYPTPNPSSSIGIRSSSPARNTHTSSTQVHHQSSNLSDEENQTVEYKNPLDDALRVKIVPNETTTLGRSSRCDYFIRSKYASRVHLKLQYLQDSNELKILCQGFNGVVINFGTELKGFIENLDQNTFYFKKSTDNKNSQTFTDLSVFRDEQITVPYLDTLTLDLKGHITLLDLNLNEYDDSETEDELPILNNQFNSSVSPSKVELVSKAEKVSLKPVENKEVNVVENKVVEQKPIEKQVEDKPAEQKDEQKAETKAEPKVQITEEKNEVIEPKVEKAATPKVEEFKEQKPASKTPELSHSRSMETIKSVEISKNIRSKSVEPSTKSNTTNTTPLQPKSESQLNKQASQQQRRRKAEPGLSPQKKKQIIKQHQQPREKISQLNIKEIIKTVEDLSNVQNVLINHLAFSRTSQTPLYQLQSVNGVTQALSRTQLRAVLFDMTCIGTIYRKGKDAAGKPLDEEYYYDLEKDNDLDRKTLVESVKGASAGLRNCRKVHKQYFWRKPTK